MVLEIQSNNTTDIDINSLGGSDDHFDIDQNKYDELQMKCLKNRTMIELWSSILTTIFSILEAVAIFLYPDHIAVALPLILICTAGLYNMVIAIEDRIYSKTPGILSFGIVAVVIITTMKSILLSDVLWCACYTFGACSSIYFIHLLFIKLLSLTVYSNPVITYTARVVKKTDGKHTSICFNDYNNRPLYYNINNSRSKHWFEGDAITAYLQPGLDEIKVKKLKHFPKYKGKTEMEYFEEKYKRDVAEFGPSQDEMDSAEGRFKFLEGYRHFFLLLGAINLFLLTAKDKLNLAHMDHNIIMVYVITLVITIVVMTLDYFRIKIKYTLEDRLIYRDNLVINFIFNYSMLYLFIRIMVELLKSFIG